MSYSSEVLADSPVGYWHLDETSGTSAADSSGNSRNGTYSSGMTLGQTSLLSFGGGTSARPDGTRYIAIPHNSAFNLSSTSDDLTFECWVKLDNPSSAALQIIADKCNLTSSRGQWVLYWDNRNVGAGTVNNLRFRYNDGSTLLDWSGSTPNAALAAGGHLVAVVKSTTVEMYWNGSLVSSASKGSGSVLSSNTDQVTFGSRSDGTGFRLTGYLDELAIYSTALSSTRIAAHYSAGTTAPSITGVIGATLPTLAASAAGDVVDQGSIAATLPALTASITATADNTSYGVVSATLPALTASADGLVTIPGVVAATLPALTASLAGDASVGDKIAATLPALSAAIAGTSTPDVVDISMDFEIGTSLDITSVLDVTPITMDFTIRTSLTLTIPRGDNPDPRTGKTQWRFIVTDRAGNRYGQLDRITADPLEDGVNVPGETQFTIATDDPKHALIRPVERECQVWRGQSLMLKGPILPGRPSDDGTTVTYSITDPRWYFSQNGDTANRTIGRVPRRNLLRNGDFSQALAYWRGGYEPNTIPALPPLVSVVDSDISESGKALQVIGADKSQLITQETETGAVFVPNSATYLSGGEAIIQGIGNNIPNGSVVQIVGYTADDGTGDGLDLSHDRALAAKGTLAAMGKGFTFQQADASRFPSGTYMLGGSVVGRGYYQQIAGGLAANRRVVISYEGTQSATGSAQYEAQSFTVTQPTAIGRPLTLTFSGWRELVNWIGPNVHEYGVYIQAVKASAPTVIVDSAYSTLDADSPRDSPQRDAATISIPPDGTAYHVEVRLYAPNGTIKWTRCQVIPGDLLAFPKTDQALIAKGILEHVQDTSKGKGDLGIATRTPLTGVIRDRWYAEDHTMPASTALAELTALYRGLDWDIVSTPTLDTLATFHPQQGGSIDVVFGPNNVVKFTPANSRDVASSIIAQADGSGPDRDEAYASDPAALGGMLLERVISAENETPVNELDEAALSELAWAKVTTPAYWVECHPKHTNALLDRVSKGDRVRVILRDGYTNVDSTARVVKRRLDPNSDSVAYMVALEV